MKTTSIIVVALLNLQIILIKSFIAPHRSLALQSPDVRKLYGTAEITSDFRSKDRITRLPLDYVSVSTNASVADAVEAMTAVKRTSVVVFNDEKRLAGIFTERDFVAKVLKPGFSAQVSVVGDFMTPLPRLITRKSNSLIGECRQIMIDNSIRHLPILDDEEALLGVASMTTIIRALQTETVQLESASLVGNTLADIERRSKDLANEGALSSGIPRQDLFRTAYVVAGAVVSAGLLQASFVHDHEFASMSLIFLLGYIGIVFENYFEFNKAAIAILMSTALWTIFAGEAGTGVVVGSAMQDLNEKLSEVSEVVFFILGAMTIVEIVDSHRGFKVVTDKISSRTKRDLMWVVGVLTFFMSAILDNLTTTIVMVSLVKKILPKLDDRKLFGAMIVVAANAGGAWTPIGDVTTTMLWINGQITALPTMSGLFLPSLVATVIPIALLRQQIPEGELVPTRDANSEMQLAPRGQLVFATGLLGLLSVPVFKTLTGLPPYLGMLAALGVMWALTDAIHAGEKGVRDDLMAPAALRKIDTSGVLFFFGILLSVGALDSAGILRDVASFLDQHISSSSLLASVIGVASAVIDNVPLVAATMGMYPLSTIQPDSQLWQLIALCAGTGGSLLVIGSAAGVALMGLEKVDFMWYAKNISASVFVGYVAAIGTYLLQQQAFSVLPAVASIF